MSTQIIEESERALIAEADVVAFLADHELHATEVTPYTDGVASRNFRATGPRNLDLTVRCDLRRSLEKVREDRRYADLAQRRGISVPVGKWVEGHVQNLAVTARPTIEGASLAQLTASQLPASSHIGEMLATLHTVPPPSGDRRFFYEGLLNESDPLWGNFPQAHAAFQRDPAMSDLIAQARSRLERHASGLRTATQMPGVMIHGDFNPPNILLSGTELVLIDWEKACTGYPVADLVQAIYYFSAWYGRQGLPFAREFIEAYTRRHDIPGPILDVWLLCFPAFIFLRDTVSASLQPLSPMGRMQLARFGAYVRNDSAPRFRYFLAHESEIREATLRAL